MNSKLGPSVSTNVEYTKQRLPIDLGMAAMNNSIDCMEGSVEDLVLYKDQAKWGCATPSRSIVERQANTTGMLDEALEYVKLLQHARFRFYAAKILLASENMHEEGIVYRELKPENMLLSADGPYHALLF